MLLLSSFLYFFSFLKKVVCNILHNKKRLATNVTFKILLVTVVFFECIGTMLLIILYIHCLMPEDPLSAQYVTNTAEEIYQQWLISQSNFIHIQIEISTRKYFTKILPWLNLSKRSSFVVETILYIPKHFNNQHFFFPILHH